MGVTQGIIGVQTTGQIRHDTGCSVWSSGRKLLILGLPGSDAHLH